MAVTNLAGVIDSGVYVIGYFPTGVDVGADMTAIINKMGDIITLLNTNETGIATNVTNIAGNDTDIATNVAAITANYNLIVANKVITDAADVVSLAAESALDARVTINEAAIAGGSNIAELILNPSGSSTLTMAQATGYNFINLENAGGGGTPTITLPATGTPPASFPATVIYNNGFTQVTIKSSDSWADGHADTEEMILNNGEAMTVRLVIDSGGDYNWGIIGGFGYDAYAQLTPEP